MMGASLRGMSGWGASAAALLCLSLSLAASIRPAEADKVGVAAAVNPDAFSSLSGSPQSQLSIGKSIFFNERINTTTSGLVQVLLVDGSTFTVGPGSDLVIDKFIYDPKKGTGQIAASMSKGVMRFVGGKISKNPDGVTVNTPAGALAIRGGMFQTNLKIFSFLFGETMTLQGKNGQSYTVFQPGNSIDLSGGLPTIRATTQNDIKAIMAALTPGGNGGVTPGQTPPPGGTGAKAAALSILSADIINEATATQIQDQINKEIANLNNTPTETPTTPGEPTTTPPPANTLALGYAAGAFTQTTQNSENGYYDRSGTMLSHSPTDVALLFDGTTKAFSGAVFNLFSDDDGGAKITFVPVNLPDSVPQDIQDQIAASGIFFGAAATSSDNPNSSIISYAHTIYGLPADPPTPDPNSPGHTIPANFAGDPPRFDINSKQVVNPGAATLIGVTGNGQIFCESCDFMTWGAWLTLLNVENGENSDHQPLPNTQISAIGWWVAADSLPTIGQLPTLGTASYDGHAIGEVLYGSEGIQTYLAKGDVHMDWDFGQRAGVLDITNFGVPGNENVPVLNASGRMDMPGVATALNKFSGPLRGTLGNDHCAPTVYGIANGSFAANGTDKTAGVIGNFSVANFGDSTFYKASGVFGAGRVGPVNPSGSLPNLPLPPRPAALNVYGGPN